MLDILYLNKTDHREFNLFAPHEGIRTTAPAKKIYS